MNKIEKFSFYEEKIVDSEDHHEEMLREFISEVSSFENNFEKLHLDQLQALIEIWESKLSHIKSLGNLIYFAKRMNDELLG